MAESGAEPAEGAGLGASAHLLAALVRRHLDLQWLDATAADSTADGHRAILTADTLYLPRAAGNTPQGGDRRLASVVHAAAHLLFSPAAQPVGRRGPIGIAVASMIEDARVERRMMRLYPGFAPLLRLQARSHPGAHGPEGSFPDLVARLHGVLLDPAQQDSHPWVAKGRALFEARIAASAHGESDPDDFQALAAVLANDLGQLRVRMNAHAFLVPYDYADDNSYLWQFDRTAETTPLASPPPPPPADGTERAAPPASESPSTIALHTYPEWDYRLARARANWTTVIEHRYAAPASRTETSTPRQRRRPQRIDHRVRLRRQWDGDELDLEAATELMLARRLGTGGDARVHQRSGRTTIGRSVLLLMDLSASANDIVDAAGTTVLALERAAALALADAVTADADRVAVHGFSSNTRNQVDYVRLCDFDPLARFDRVALRRHLERLQARHSTRLGAAIRHAAALLTPEQGRARHLVILSDGEPSDIDVFDPRYLREDVAVAVRAAHRRGITVHCLALDPEGDTALARILPPGRHQLVLARQHLQPALLRLLSRLG